MNPRVELVLRNSESPEKLISVFIEPTGIPLASRWIEELRKALREGFFLEKDQSFSGFLDPDRDEIFLVAKINEVLTILRNYRGRGPWKNGYDVPELSIEEALSADGMNRLHHHFELLRGQYWDPSPYIQVGVNLEVNNAIRALNSLVHRMESVMLSKAGLEKHGRIFPFSVVHFVAQSNNYLPALKEEDYDSFSFEEDFGLVQMHYCQIGKTHYQAWCDGDANIFAENVNNLRIYSSGFTITWAEKPPPGIKSSDLFLESLKRDGIDLSRETYFLDRNGMKQGLGFLNIGRVPLAQFGGLSPPEVQSLLAAHDDIYQIRLHEGAQVLESTFNYRLDDETYADRLMKAIGAPLRD
ncbi:MAG: hypothetical protein ACXWQO_16375 [Bdellovibrionota bacterium]